MKKVLAVLLLLVLCAAVGLGVYALKKKAPGESAGEPAVSSSEDPASGSETDSAASSDASASKPANGSSVNDPEDIQLPVGP